MTADKPQPFEQIMERLETIAQKLEQGDGELEEALGLFEEGVRLAKDGNARLDAAERKIEVLLADGSTEDLDVGSTDS